MDTPTKSDDSAGLGATAGLWTHVAVTWTAESGVATLYVNGARVWAVRRSRGVAITAGGTLIVGREQDCLGARSK